MGTTLFCFVLTSANYFLSIITESILMDESTTVFVLIDKFRSLAALQMVEFYLMNKAKGHSKLEMARFSKVL